MIDSAQDSTVRTATVHVRNYLLAESSKLLSLPATWLILIGTLALTVILSVAFGTSVTGNIARASGASILDYGVTAVTWTQCGFFLLGVIASTSEYVGGQIRTTFVAMPDRVAQRLAASTALAVLSFVTGVVVVVSSIGAMLLTTAQGADSLLDGTAARIILSAAGYLALMAVLSSALGVLIRRAVPAAAILLVYLLIVSPLLQGQRWYFLPDVASYTLWFANVPGEAPPAPLAWCVLAVWTFAVLLPSIVVAQRRDT